MEIIRREIQYFKLLNPAARALLLSFIAFNIASPLLGIFANAYIWRQTQAMHHLAIFNAMWIVGVTLAFIFNGFLLRWISVSHLYAAGLFLQSAANLVLFLIAEISIYHLICLGLFLGSMAGIYWSNRNLLTFQVTHSKERDYFCSLESALVMLLASVSPVLFGWFIQLGELAGIFDVMQRYQILMAVALAIQALGSYGIIRAKFRDSEPQKLFLRNPTRSWNLARTFTAIKGVADGSNLFLPTLMVLFLVGNEGTLGTVQSLAVIVSSGVLYYVARWMTKSTRIVVLTFGVVCIFIGAVSLSFAFSVPSAIVYVLLQTLGIQLLWATANPIILDAINMESGDADQPYEYVVDRELSLNVGRLTGILTFLAMVYLIGDEATLRFCPLILAFLQGFLLLTAKKLIKLQN